jgi:adenylyltransferase/sulfurtransferase
MSPTGAEDARFARQQLLPGIGPAGQQLIRDARIHVVGAGAAAGPALLYLTQAGVGTIYVDDGGDVDDQDAGSWLFTPDQVGQPRLFAAIEVLRGASSFVRVRAYATDTEPTATLVCSQREPVARTAAERARMAGLPHVVALASGDGGEVLAIPSGAPCFGCASRPGARLPPHAGAAAAIGTLAAVELLLVVARVLPGNRIGRRIDLAEGWPSVRPTARIPGCDCHAVH